jgi:hypothetical protein
VAKKRSGGESEHHIVGVRFRVTGSGNLDLRLVDLDNTRTFQMIDLPLESTIRIEPTRLANFQSQRTRLEGRIQEIDEHFHIRRIIIFAKPVAMEYPG